MRVLAVSCTGADDAAGLSFSSYRPLSHSFLDVLTVDRATRALFYTRLALL